MTAPPTKPRPPIWQALLGVVISVGLLAWTLHGVQWHEVVQHLAEARPMPILLGVVFATLTFVLRIFRWQLLLRGEHGERLPALPLWHAIAMGFMANNVLPLRMGEVVRTFAGSKLTGVRFTAALASIAVERLFDSVAVVSLLGVGLLTTHLDPHATAGFGIHRIIAGAGVLIVIGLGTAALVVAFPLAAEKVVRRIVPGERLAQRLVTIIEGIRQGFSALRSPLRVVGVALWSFAIWGLSALSFYVMFGAFGITVDFPGALLMQGLIMFGIAVPSTPGYVGVFEAPIRAVLGLYGVSASLVAAYALTYHVTTFLPITLLGAWSVFRTNLGLTAFRREQA